MILGITHVGITVSDMEVAVAAISKALGLTVVSDAPRQGSLSDQVYHTRDSLARVVYLSVNTFQHLELFHFTNPSTLPVDRNMSPRPGIQYSALHFRRSIDVAGLTAVEPASWLDPAVTMENGLFEASTVNNVQDVNGCVFRVFSSCKGDKMPSSALDDSLLYPSIIVRNLNDSLAFYCGVLGLEVWEQGSGRADSAGGRQCALLRSPWGLCLMLVQSDVIATAGAESNIWRKPGFTHLTLAVHQLDSYFTTLVKRDVKFWFSPTDLTVGPHSGGRLVFFTTPDGLVVELIDSPLTRARVG